MSYKTSWKGNLAILLVVALILPLLSGCTQTGTNSSTGSDGSHVPGASSAVSTHPGETVAETTVPTEPPATTPADGDPNDVTCQGSYTVEDAQPTADTVVAHVTATWTELVEKETTPTEESSGKATEPVIEYEEITVTEEYPLTNSQLQLYYWMAVDAYQRSNWNVAPDFTKPLDTQICKIDDTVNSWQQYFLREALNTWTAAQNLTIWGQLEGIPVIESYKIREDLHKKHLTDEIPALRLLYGYNKGYTPNEQHQAYLDSISDMLAELAVKQGFSSVDALAQDLAGTGATAEALHNYVSLYNQGYMFLTELGYELETNAEEVEAYFTEHEAEYAAQGITRDSGKYVDMRHILLRPKDATVAEDGTVTAEELEWTRLGWKATELLSSIYATYPYSEGVFATFAANHSLDAGSAMNGGLYQNLVKGQMPKELDNWLFSEKRQPGDKEIITTALGTHIVYFCKSTDFWYAAAENDLMTQKYQALASEAMAKYPVTIDYSAISLGTATRSCDSICADSLLYADIAHERYPEAPLYLQQDYQGTRYGAYSVVTHGCGITTLAMTASYMSDEQHTVPELCATYGRYCTEHGSDRTLFVHTPGDLGFYLKEQVFNASKAYEALQQGYVVVGLQHAGYWTRGGHYLLFEQINENGSVLVRDSNIYNYNKLEGHYVDEHDWKTVPGAAITFWIYYPKYTNCSQCIRCTDGTAEAAPDALFNSTYQCGDCSTALLRRNAYLNK